MTNEIIQYERPNQEVMLNEAVGILDCAKDITITSPAMYQLAADELQSVKSKINELNAKRVSITSPLDIAKKAVMDLFRVPLERYSEAEKVLKASMLTYSNEQERLRKLEQARLDAIAKAERERIEAEARAIRQEAERKAAEEEAVAARIAATNREKQRIAEEAAAKLVADAKNETDKEAAIIAQQEAIKQAEFDRIAAEQHALNRKEEQRIAEEKALQSSQILQEQAKVTTATLTVAAPKPTGTSIRGTWKARCINKAALVKFVSERPEYLGLLDVSDSALNSIAKAQKENMSIGGCESYLQQSVASRRK